MSLGIETRCIHGNLNRFDKDGTGSISFPIYQTATFAHRGVGKSTGFDYSRLQNPTREQLEKIVASLEGGVTAVAGHLYGLRHCLFCITAQTSCLLRFGPAL